MPADPKPRPRIIDPDAGWEKVLAEGHCRLCWRTASLTRHHLVPRGQSGDDVDDNIVPLCGDGTRGCHGAVEHYTEARRRLRPLLSDAEWAYVVGRVGVGRAEQRYPG